MLRLHTLQPQSNERVLSSDNLHRALEKFSIFTYGAMQCGQMEIVIRREARWRTGPKKVSNGGRVGRVRAIQALQPVDDFAALRKFVQIRIV